MLKMSDNETLLNLACALRYQDRIGNERAEVRTQIMRHRGRQGGKATAAKREMTRLASIGIRPIQVKG